jgi:serine phosphatase RsbU (regulator of sigma subunit)
MKRAIQWLSDLLSAVFPQFMSSPQSVSPATDTQTEGVVVSAKKHSGALIATAVFAGLITVVDTLFLTAEASFFHAVSVGVTSVLKVGIAAVYAGIFASLYPVRGKEPLAAVQPVTIFTRASKYLALSSLVMIAGGNIFGEVISPDRSEDIVRLFIASFVSLAGVAIIVQQFQWLDTVIAIRRTEMTGKFRSAALILVILLVATKVLAGVVGFDSDGVMVALMVVVAVFFFLAILRLPWLTTFSKDQKWRALGVSVLALGLSGAIAGMAADDSHFLRSFELLLPGLRSLIMLSAILVCMLFSRVSLSLVLALPTATVIDRKINEVKSLSYLSRTISQVYDLERLLSIVTTMIQDVCGATSSWIELLDEETEKIRLAAQLKISPQQLQMLYKDGVLRSVLDAQADDMTQSIYFEALDEERAFAAVYPYTTDFAQSLIAVPLLLDGKRIGTVFAAHRDKFAFEFEDISLLSAFANNISIAIENARLFENSLEQERYKREMMLAREMQQKLLPKELPHLQAFDIAAYSSPALEVGGDYYDCVQLSHGQWCMIIGDVSGKGITAAFYMAELKGVAMAVAKESSSPKDLLERINAALLGSVEKGSYITMTAAMLDESRQELVVARAGHTPIALYTPRQGHTSHPRNDADGDTDTDNTDIVQLLTPRGFGVALVKSELFNPALEELRIAMPQGARCLVFTDGINEAMNARREEFGYDPICFALQAELRTDAAHLYKNGQTSSLHNASLHNASLSGASPVFLHPAEMLVGDVVRRVAEFTGGVAQHDDITMIGIVSTGSSPETAQRADAGSAVANVTEVSSGVEDSSEVSKARLEAALEV